MTSPGSRSLGGRVDRWLLASAPAERLAAFRILVGLFVVIYLAVRFPVFVELADGRPSRFDPVGVLWFLDAPLDPAVIHLTLVMALVAAVHVLAGAGHRVMGPVLAGALTVLFTYRSSWSQLLHFENLVLLHVVVVAFAPASHRWSVDALIRRHRDAPPPGPGTGTRYGWPLRLAALITAVTYVVAGVAKVRYGGWGWLDGDTLRNHIAYTAARLDVFGEDHSPIAGPLVSLSWLFTPLAVAGVAIEVGAPAALLSRRLRNLWVTAAVGMHAFVAAAMYIVFPYPLFGVAFAPLFALEEAGDRISRWFRVGTRARSPGQMRDEAIDDVVEHRT